MWFLYKIRLTEQPRYAGRTEVWIVECHAMPEQPRYAGRTILKNTIYRGVI